MTEKNWDVIRTTWAQDAEKRRKAIEYATWKALNEKPLTYEQWHAMAFPEQHK